MDNKAVVLASMLGLVLIVGAVYFLSSGEVTLEDSKEGVASDDAEEVVSDIFLEREDLRDEDVVVVFDGEGFLPEEATVEVGARVVWMNESDEGVWVATDPYPEQSDYPAFNSLQDVLPNMGWGFVFEVQGEWSYHNHLNPEQGGVVTVE